MTEEQKRALALARARQRASQAAEQPQSPRDMTREERAQARAAWLEQQEAERLQAGAEEYMAQLREQPFQPTSVMDLLGQPGIDTDQLRRQAIADEIGPAQAALQGAAQGVSFGANDEINGFVSGLANAATNWNEGGSVMDEDRSLLARALHRYNDGYQETRDLTRDVLDVAREEHPVAAYGGEIAGAVMAPGAALGNAARGASLGRRVGTGIVAGGGTGAVYGFNAGEGGIDQRLESAKDTATIGAIAGGAVPVATSALKRLWEGQMRRRATNQMISNAPSADDLFAQANDLYEGVKGAGQFATPQQMAGVRTQAQAALQRDGVLDGAGNVMQGYGPAMRPMQTLDEVATNGLDGRQIQPVKDLLREAADSPKGTHAKVGQILFDAYDAAVKGMSPVRAQADDLFSRAKRVGEVDQLMQRADLEDTPNSLRTKFRELGRKDIKDQLPGWSPDEIAAALRVSKGGKGERALRFAGSVAPNSALSVFAGTTGPGLLGYALGGPTGAAIATGGTMLAGGLAKRGANSIQRRNAELAKALERVRLNEILDSQNERAVIHCV